MPKSVAPSFVPDTFRFLRELDRHNDREWFEANKPRYLASVLDPAVQFVQAVGPALEKISSQVAWDPRPYGGSVSRIYRDTRFAKDKRPYRTEVGIHFGHRRAAESGTHLPGFFLHLAPGASAGFSGVWQPEAVALGRIREAIVREPDRWGKLAQAVPLSEGDAYARVPKGFDPGHPFAADLRRKDFFASVPFKDAEVSSVNFPRTFVAACRRLDPLNGFLSQAMRVPW